MGLVYTYLFINVKQLPRFGEGIRRGTGEIPSKPGIFLRRTE